jgi:hypothetical protein
MEEPTEPTPEQLQRLREAQTAQAATAAGLDQKEASVADGAQQWFAEVVPALRVLRRAERNRVIAKMRAQLDELDELPY